MKVVIEGKVYDSFKSPIVIFWDTLSERLLFKHTIDHLGKELSIIIEHKEGEDIQGLVKEALKLLGAPNF